MPRPLFIICSDSGSIDRYSNCISAYKIIESIQVFSAQNIQEALENAEDAITTAPFFRLRMVAVWISDDEDRGEVFDFETRLILPTAVERIGGSTFVWKSRNHRFITDIMLPTEKVDEGIVRVVSAIRRHEPAGEWLSQEYEIQAEVKREANHPS